LGKFRRYCRLLQNGHQFLDVRSEVEFALGHVPGAFNIPLLHPVGDTLVPNDAFIAVVTATFPHNSQLIVGCHSESRTGRACELLLQAQFSHVLQLKNGWGGSRDAFGRLIPGWLQLGLPQETGDGAARSYASLHRPIAQRGTAPR
jgi:rhodanese-related sulfurtransferase